MAIIYFTEKNIHGGYTIYGIDGVKQYYGYTKDEAEKRYRSEAKEKIFVNKAVK